VAGTARQQPDRLGETFGANQADQLHHLLGELGIGDLQANRTCK
jgi:hypothetical protein